MVRASAWVGLTLPGMIEEPGSFSGRISSPKPERGPEPSRRIVCDLEQIGGERIERTMGEHQRAMRRERLELVQRANERQPGHAGDARGKQLGETRVGIQSGADRGAALRQRIKLAQAELEAGDAGGDLRRI